MRPTGGFGDWPTLAVGLVEAIEPRIGIRLHQPGEACQMLLGMLAATIARIEEHRRRRVRASKRPVVAHIGPYPAGAALPWPAAAPWCRRHRCVHPQRHGFGSPRPTASASTLDFSRPGKPKDNAFIEAFNGRFRAECLNAHRFLSLADAREKLEDWRKYYNEERPMGRSAIRRR
jgi:hypothetical protein